MVAQIIAENYVFPMFLVFVVTNLKNADITKGLQYYGANIAVNSEMYK